MKKWIALTLSLFLSLSLTACGGQDAVTTPDAGEASEDVSEPAENPRDTQVPPDALPEENADEPSDNAPADADANLPEDNTQIANPFTDYTTYEEAEAAAGFPFGVPEEIGSYQAKAYRVAESLSLFEVIYEDGEASLTVRKSPGEQNISGDYHDYPVEIAETVQGVNVSCWGEGESLSLALWTLGDDSYSLGATESMDRMDFLGAVETIIALNAV